jgi:hypothetical protein
MDPIPHTRSGQLAMLLVALVAYVLSARHLKNVQTHGLALPANAVRPFVNELQKWVQGCRTGVLIGLMGVHRGEG